MPGQSHEGDRGTLHCRMPPSSKGTVKSQETGDAADGQRRVQAPWEPPLGDPGLGHQGTGASLYAGGAGKGGATCGCRLGVAPAPPGGRRSSETVVAAPLGLCTVGTEFPCLCWGSGCWAVVLGWMTTCGPPCPTMSPWDLPTHPAPHGPTRLSCSGAACPTSLQAVGRGASAGPGGGCTQGTLR